MRWILLSLLSLILPAQARQVKLDVRLSEPLMLAGKKHTNYLKVGLTGFDMASKERPSVNVALVIDKSGSMSGEKIARAKEAAMMAVKRLGSQDIISVIAYDSGVRVLVPATKAGDKQFVIRGIQRISAGGNTALFAGVSKGADELRKFLDKKRANRLILLSDGLANVGPSSPGELAHLGNSLGREGISITTLGLGLDYNEDLMSRLARSSEGNHVFVEQAKDLRRFFDLEFGDVLSVVAQEVKIQIDCAPGVRPVRVLGREVDIVGQQVSARMNQLYASHEKFLLLELEVPPGETGSDRPIAEVKLSYNNMITSTQDELKSSIRAGFCLNSADVERRRDQEVMIKTVEMISNDNNRQALELRDQGKTKEARKVLLSNSSFLKHNAVLFDSSDLKNLSEANFEDAENLAPKRWKKRRKQMRRAQHKLDIQQSF